MSNLRIVSLSQLFKTDAIKLGRGKMIKSHKLCAKQRKFLMDVSIQ